MTALDELAEPGPAVTIGEILDPLDDDHPPHVYLYVPDLSAETGWGAHRVPLTPERPRRPVGFGRE